MQRPTALLATYRLHFRQSIDHFNFNDAYLVPDENERAHWRKIFQQIGQDLKLVFAGKPPYLAKHTIVTFLILMNWIRFSL